MKHSVILTSYNRPKMIRTSILSILEQTFQDFELVICDDGSNEETISSINDLIKNDSRCILLTVQHEDDAKIRSDCAFRVIQRINDAIKIVSGDIIHYLADDDWFHKERFRIFEGVMAKDDVAVSYGRLVYMLDEKTDAGQDRYPAEVSDPYCVLDYNQVAHKRFIFKEVPVWVPDPVDYASDGHFFRAISKKWAFHGVDKVVAYKRGHAFNMQRTCSNTTGERE
jgi:glycosyltransferase involved in cell wall biosynthesis